MDTALKRWSVNGRQCVDKDAAATAIGCSLNTLRTRWVTESFTPVPGKIRVYAMANGRRAKKLYDFEDIAAVLIARATETRIANERLRAAAGAP
jgi:hypothetical protein